MPGYFATRALKPQVAVSASAVVCPAVGRFERNTARNRSRFARGAWALAPPASPPLAWPPVIRKRTASSAATHRPILRYESVSGVHLASEERRRATSGQKGTRAGPAGSRLVGSRGRLDGQCRRVRRELHQPPKRQAPVASRAGLRAVRRYPAGRCVHRRDCHAAGRRANRSTSSCARCLASCAVHADLGAAATLGHGTIFAPSNVTGSISYARLTTSRASHEPCD